MQTDVGRYSQPRKIAVHGWWHLHVLRSQREGSELASPPLQAAFHRRTKILTSSGFDGGTSAG